ncbi:MAG: hypothetical protein V2A67_04450 [Bacteroidota bacterium]
MEKNFTIKDGVDWNTKDPHDFTIKSIRINLAKPYLVEKFISFEYKRSDDKLIPKKPLPISSNDPLIIIPSDYQYYLNVTYLKIVILDNDKKPWTECELATVTYEQYPHIEAQISMGF